MKHMKRWCGVLGLMMCGHQAGAQIPMPTPRPLTSELRQKLRTEILKIAASERPEYSNARPKLALPLAQLGDWQGAMKLLRADMNAPAAHDEVWQWRAEQLSAAGKWREVLVAAASIRRTEVRVDALLFAVRALIERGATLDEGSDGRNLRTLLPKATQTLPFKRAISQRAYTAYLWARSGDKSAAERIFQRAIAESQRIDAYERAQSRKNPRQYHPAFLADETDTVLSFMVSAGLVRLALPYLEDRDSAGDIFRIRLGNWIMEARTASDLQAFENVIEKSKSRSMTQWAPNFYALSIAHSLRGELEPGRAWFKRARALDSAAQFDYIAYIAAYYLRDEELQTQMLDELRVVAQNSPPRATVMKPAEVEVLPLCLELNIGGILRAATPPLNAARLEIIAQKLMSAPPSEWQFRALENVAARFFALRRVENLRAVAFAMHKTAQALGAQENAERNKNKNALFNPYWLRVPSVLTAIFWLQRAGENAIATN